MSFISDQELLTDLANSRRPSAAKRLRRSNDRARSPLPARVEIPDEKLEGWKRSLQDTKTRTQLVRLLAKTLIFADTTEAFRQGIVDAVAPAEFDAGQVVFRHGEPGDWMGILLSGRLERRLQRVSTEIVIGDVGPGGIIGDLGMFGLNPNRSFTVVALTHVVMLLLTQEMFEDAVARVGGPKSLSLFRDSYEMQNLMADTESFVNLKCFRKLDRDFVLTLRANSEPRLCYPKQILMKEGHFGDEMYILRSGTVKIEKDGKFVVELPSGTVLGELAVLGTDKRRTATVTCTSLCLIRALHADVFHEILDRFPSAKRVFEHAYVARLVSVHVQSAKEEKCMYDKFYGSATPRTRGQMQELFGSQMQVESPRMLSSMKAVSPHKGVTLPKLSMNKKKMQQSPALTDSPRPPE